MKAHADGHTPAVPDAQPRSHPAARMLKEDLCSDHVEGIVRIRDWRYRLSATHARLHERLRSSTSAAWAGLGAKSVAELHLRRALLLSSTEVR